MPLHPPLPSPSTWSSGEVVLAPTLRADVSDTVALLNNPPMAVLQQQFASQSIPSSTTTTIQMDFEVFDPWSGHQIGTGGFEYYGMFAGWYLCECNVPLAYTGGAGTLGAYIGGVQNGSSNNQFGGQRVPNNSGNDTSVVAAKLMHQVQVGTFGSGDFINAKVFQSSGSPQPLLNGTARFPGLSVRWVAASSGTAGLAVPANPAWPNTSTTLTATFMNTNIRNAVRFLIYRPIMEYSRASTSGTLASQASVPTVGTTVSLDTSTVDNYSAFSTGTNTWTAPVAGVYYCYGSVGVVSGAGANALAAGLTVTSANYNSGTQITLWGGGMDPNPTTVSNNIVRLRLRLNAGDTVLLAGFYNDSGSASASYNGTGDFPSRLIIVWEGA